MKQQTICSVCGANIAIYACPACGRNVCKNCFDKSSGACIACKSGRRL